MIQSKTHYQPNTNWRTAMVLAVFIGLFGIFAEAVGKSNQDTNYGPSIASYCSPTITLLCDPGSIQQGALATNQNH